MNKLIALGLVGAAAWLFKTKKGAEVRKQITKSAGEWGQKIKDDYATRTTQKDSQPA